MPPESVAPPPPARTAAERPRTARERARAEITREITDVARAHLAVDDAARLSLRAIAREMGMSSSALFRYFPNRDALLTTLIVESYSALADAAEQAEARVHDGTVEERWLAVCHAVRDWAVGHPHEYALIFGTPVPGYAAPQDTVAPATRVPVLLGTLLGDLLASGAYDPSTHAVPPAAVVHAVEPVLATMPDGVPADLAVRGLMAWTYLFGAISFEIFGHRGPAVRDARTFFDHEMRRVGAAFGLTVPPSG